MTNDYGNLELHKVLLSAMKDVDKICRENGIKYFLHAGTLLGAVNHKGFIPWDDDVDISMLRQDYEKFLKIVQDEYSKIYFVQTYLTDENYKNNRAVLRVLGTRVNHFHEDENDLHNEVAIDIVPLDAVPNSVFLQKCQQGVVWILDAAVQIKQGDITPHNPVIKLIGLLSHINRQRLGKAIDFTTSFFNNRKTKQIGLLSYTGKNPYTGVSGYYNDVMQRKWYNKPIYLPFEDTQFMTISDPNADLIHRYGPHYMDPYPEEKRVTKHDIKSYNIEDWVWERIK